MKLRGSNVAGGLLLVFLLWLVIYPLILVLVEGFQNSSGWTLDYLRLFFARRNEAQAFWGSLWISVATVVLAAAIGTGAGVADGFGSSPENRRHNVEAVARTRA